MDFSSSRSLDHAAEGRPGRTLPELLAARGARRKRLRDDGSVATRSATELALARGTGRPELHVIALELPIHLRLCWRLRRVHVLSSRSRDRVPQVYSRCTTAHTAAPVPDRGFLASEPKVRAANDVVSPQHPRTMRLQRLGAENGVLVVTATVQPATRLHRLAVPLRARAAFRRGGPSAPGRIRKRRPLRLRAAPAQRNRR
jgi:hypothetical protein